MLVDYYVHSHRGVVVVQLLPARWQALYLMKLAVQNLFMAGSTTLLGEESNWQMVPSRRTFNGNH